MISTKGRYAVRVMIDLAQHSDGETYTPLKDIAARQEISKKDLEIIVRDLVAGVLVSGVSGKKGGYRLSRVPEAYTVGEILELTERSIAAVACLEGGEQSCPRSDTCPSLPMWTELNALVHDYFYSKKLSDLVSQGTNQQGTVL